MLTFKLNRLSNFDLFRFFPTIDLIQHQNFQEKQNPFHCIFINTQVIFHKIFEFMLQNFDLWPIFTMICLINLKILLHNGKKLF